MSVGALACVMRMGIVPIPEQRSGEGAIGFFATDALARFVRYNGKVHMMIPLEYLKQCQFDVAEGTLTIRFEVSEAPGAD